MTPQLTEQYGQVGGVWVVREIFSSRAWAYMGCKSKPRAARAPALRKVRRVSMSLRNAGPEPACRALQARKPALRLLEDSRLALRQPGAHAARHAENSLPSQH